MFTVYLPFSGKIMKSASSMVYLNLKSPIRSVLYSEAPVSEPPAEIVLSDSDESEMEFPGQNDDNYSPGLELHAPKPL